MYVEAQAVTIRRLADKDRRTVSFYRLLTDMLNDSVTPNVTDEELINYRNDLVRDAAKVAKYVNRKVAHRDRLASSPLTWGDLNEAIDRIGEHMTDVSIVVTGSIWTPEVYLTPGWQDVFAPGLFVPPWSVWEERQQWERGFV